MASTDRAEALAYPDIDKELIERLEAAFPPRCYDGRGRLEAHLLYAGKVELIATLRDIYTQQAELSEPLPDDFLEDGA